MYYETNCAEETYLIGKKMGEAAQKGEIYCLDGDLGTGKTVFAQGFAAGLGVREAVNSPTFTIVQIYEEGRLPLFHFDVYRIAEPEEMEEIGYEDYFYGDGVCLVEWSELIAELLPAGAVHICLSKEPTQGDDYRRIDIITETTI